VVEAEAPLEEPSDDRALLRIDAIVDMRGLEQQRRRGQLGSRWTPRP
jgi:hypothetical protein